MSTEATEPRAGGSDETNEPGRHPVGERGRPTYGTNYDAALDAYERAEQDARDHSAVEVVLLSADSLETIKRTHSSYFHKPESFETLLPAGLRT